MAATTVGILGTGSPVLGQDVDHEQTAAPVEAHATALCRPEAS